VLQAERASAFSTSSRTPCFETSGRISDHIIEVFVFLALLFTHACPRSSSPRVTTIQPNSCSKAVDCSPTGWPNTCSNARQLQCRRRPPPFRRASPTLLPAQPGSRCGWRHRPRGYGSRRRL
jgi:hypothetical protein